MISLFEYMLVFIVGVLNFQWCKKGSTNSLVTGYVIINGECKESRVNIDDFNSRVTPVTCNIM